MAMASSERSFSDATAYNSIGYNGALERMRLYNGEFGAMQFLGGMPYFLRESTDCVIQSRDGEKWLHDMV